MFVLFDVLLLSCLLESRTLFWTIVVVGWIFLVMIILTDLFTICNVILVKLCWPVDRSYGGTVAMAMAFPRNPFAADVLTRVANVQKCCNNKKYRNLNLLP